jgi:hypothetical protein
LEDKITSKLSHGESIVTSSVASEVLSDISIAIAHNVQKGIISREDFEYF